MAQLIPALTLCLQRARTRRQAAAAAKLAQEEAERRKQVGLAGDCVSMLFELMGHDSMSGGASVDE